jgi:hypothetical protein
MPFYFSFEIYIFFKFSYKNNSRYSKVLPVALVLVDNVAC